VPAGRELRGFLEHGLAGVYRQAWDRLREAGYDVDLRQEPSAADARALLWLAEQRRPQDPGSLTDDA
jgi:hypothetical protein